VRFARYSDGRALGEVDLAVEPGPHHIQCSVRSLVHSRGAGLERAGGVVLLLAVKHGASDRFSISRQERRLKRAA